MADTTIPDIVVYTKDACVQCTATTRKLNDLGLPFRTADAVESREVLVAHGLLQAPVVVVGGNWDTAWSGFRPDNLKAIKTAATAA